MKRLKTIILASGLLFAPLISVGDNVATITLAEETFEEKTYTYVCEEGTITITLKSATELVFTMTDKNGEVKTSTCSYIRVGNVITLNLLGQEVKIEVNDETMSFVEYVEEQSKALLDKIAELEKTIKSQADDIANKEIVAGISIGGIISFAFLVLSCIVRIAFAKKKDNIQELRNNAFQERLELLESHLKDLLKRENALTTGSQEFINKSCEELNLMKDNCMKLLKEVQRVIPNLEHYEQFNQKINCIMLVLEKMSFTPENVKAGISEQVQKLINEVK